MQHLYNGKRLLSRWGGGIKQALQEEAIFAHKEGDFEECRLLGYVDLWLL
jgi:hypothetical protein